MAHHGPYKGYEISSLQLPNGNWQGNFGIPGQRVIITPEYQRRDDALTEAKNSIDGLTARR